MNKVKLTLILLVVIVTIITCINPIYPHEQFLQHAGTILLLIPLTSDVIKNKIPTLAFVGIVVFTLLHVIGARYIYSYVPYKDWAISLGIVGADYFHDLCIFLLACCCSHILYILLRSGSIKKGGWLL